MDVFHKPITIDEDIVKNLGPLTPLAGTWEGEKGIDISPSRTGHIETQFRERLTFEPMGPVVNGPQVLYGLRYVTVAWPLGQEKPFHEEVGYWLWDARSQQVMRCFIVPRGVTVQAGGLADPEATKFEMAADVGSETFGITSNPFLDQAFKTVYFKVTVTLHDSSEQPVAGATVSGAWSAGANGSASCDTDASGQCTLVKQNLKSNVASVTLGITGVTHATDPLTYANSANHDPDGDSDGTDITVSRP